MAHNQQRQRGVWLNTDTCPSVGDTPTSSHLGTHGHVSLCWGLPSHKPSWRKDTCPTVGSPLGKRTLVPLLGSPQPLCWGLPNFFGIFYFHLPGVAQHCTRNGLTWRKSSFGLCCTHVPSARRWKAEIGHHTQVGCKEGCVQRNWQGYQSTVVHSHPTLSQQVRMPWRMALAEVINLINDLVTAVKPGVWAGASENLFVRMEPRHSIKQSLTGNIFATNDQTQRSHLTGLLLFRFFLGN